MNQTIFNQLINNQNCPQLATPAFQQALAKTGIQLHQLYSKHPDTIQVPPHFQDVKEFYLQNALSL